MELPFSSAQLLMANICIVHYLQLQQHCCQHYLVEYTPTFTPSISDWNTTLIEKLRNQVLATTSSWWWSLCGNKQGLHTSDCHRKPRMHKVKAPHGKDQEALLKDSCTTAPCRFKTTTTRHHKTIQLASSWPKSGGLQIWWLLMPSDRCLGDIGKGQRSSLETGTFISITSPE